MTRSQLTNKITDLDEWLLINPTHEDYSNKHRELTHLNQQLKQHDINEAFPSYN